MRLRKLAIDDEKDAPGVPELAYRQSFQVWCFQRLSTALTRPPEPISRSSARRSGTAYRRDTAYPRTIELVYQARYISEMRHRDAKSLRPC